MIQKTMLEILDETVAYYGSDPSSKRGVAISGCKYTTPDGRMCAVGRCCVAPSVDWIGGCENIRGLDMTKFLELETLLKPEYKGHPISFWIDLQSLHDTRRYFDDVGLTEEGLRWVKTMRTNITENRYGVQTKQKLDADERKPLVILTPG